VPETRSPVTDTVSYGAQLTQLAARRGDDSAIVLAAGDGTETAMTWWELEVRANQPGDAPSAEVLRRSCRDRLATYKVPKSFELVDRLPRSDAGKLNRGLLAHERVSSPTEVT
jgi:acyl-CoA synthetase (AMP-forming)/AMP-acid ligase II